MDVTNEPSPKTPLAFLLSLAEARAPLRFRPWLEQARRDASVVEEALLHGRRPSPLVTRPVRAATTPKVAVVVPRADEASSPAPAPARPVIASFGVTVIDGDVEHSLRAKDGQYLLEAVLTAGASVPFSCTLGGCGSCKVKLVAGDIEVEEPHCLTPEELDHGYRLLCVGRAASDCVVRVDRQA